VQIKSKLTANLTRDRGVCLEITEPPPRLDALSTAIERADGRGIGAGAAHE
jgi:hypothetical protein